MANNNNFENSDAISDFVDHPKEHIEKAKSKIVKSVESVKSGVKKVLPEPVKPVMEGDTGDIALVVIISIIFIIVMKIVGMAFRLIMNFIFIISIIAAGYILYKHYVLGS